MQQKKPLILFGTGKAFGSIWKLEVLQRMFPAHEIVAVLDNHPKAETNVYRLGNRTFQVQQNAPVFWQTAERTYAGGYDVFITSTKYQKEIKEQLTREMDVPAASILPHDAIVDAYYRVLFSGEALQGRGIEIGGPTSTFHLIYETCMSCDNVNFAAENMWNRNAPPERTSVFRKTIINEATDLKDIDSGTYDFLLSSHNLEHTANPLKALKEFQRVLRPGGLLILALPDKSETFDHNRPDTSMEHLLEDERNDVDEHDMTHLEEVLKLHDLSMDIPMTYQYFVERCLDNYHNRGIHQHVFSLLRLRQMAEYLHWEIIELCRFPRGFFLKARVR